VIQVDQIATTTLLICCIEYKNKCCVVILPLFLFRVCLWWANLWPVCSIKCV